MSLAWMLLLTLVVFAEKVLPFGPRAAQIVGVTFLILGVVVAVGAAELPGYLRLHSLGEPPATMCLSGEAQRYGRFGQEVLLQKTEAALSCVGGRTSSFAVQTRATPPSKGGEGKGGKDEGDVSFSLRDRF